LHSDRQTHLLFTAEFSHWRQTRKNSRERDRLCCGGFAPQLASPEDVILAKLLWEQQSQSEKQWRAVPGVLKVQGNSLNFAYRNEWAAQLDLTEFVQRAIAAGLSSAS
jgi:hypothetical protein